MLQKNTFHPNNSGNVYLNKVVHYYRIHTNIVTLRMMCFYFLQEGEKQLVKKRNTAT